MEEEAQIWAEVVGRDSIFLVKEDAGGTLYVCSELRDIQ